MTNTSIWTTLIPRSQNNQDVVVGPSTFRLKRIAPCRSVGRRAARGTLATVDTCDGEKGALITKYLQTTAWVWDDREDCARCWHLLVRHEIGADTPSHYCMSNDPLHTFWQTLVHVQTQRFFIEHSFREAKSECGLDDYQVRRWDA